MYACAHVHTHLHTLWSVRVADKAYREMKSLKQSQSIIVSGEIQTVNAYNELASAVLLSSSLSLSVSACLPPLLLSSPSFSLSLSFFQGKVEQERQSPPNTFSGELRASPQ